MAFLGLEVLALVVAYLWASHQIARGYGFPLDDSWIYAVFARNLAEGRGMVYNPGQSVSPTGILYALILACLYKISASPVAVAVILGVSMHLAACFTVYLTARELDLGETPSILAAALFAAIPRLIWGALSGMEVPLYVLLVCLGLYWHVRFRLHDGAKAYLPTFAFALATLARPECGAFLGASVVERMVAAAGSGDARNGLRRYAVTLPAHLALFCVVLAPAIAFNLISTRMPLPPAFYVKAGNVSSGGVFAALDYVWQALRVCARDNVVMAIGVIVGAVACLRKPMRPTALLLPLSFLIVPAATGLLAHRQTGTNQLLFQAGRYSAYLAPLGVLMAAVGFVWLSDRVGRWRPTVALAALLLVVGMLVRDNRALAENYAWGVQNVNNMQVAVGKWARGLPEDAVLAVNDAGAIAYFSRHRIIDTVGVVNPELARHLAHYRSKQKGLLDYLAGRRPDYVIIFPSWYDRIVARPRLLKPVKRFALAHNVVCGERSMVVYKPNWDMATSTEATGSSPLSLRPGRIPQERTSPRQRRQP